MSKYIDEQSEEVMKLLRGQDIDDVFEILDKCKCLMLMETSINLAALRIFERIIKKEVNIETIRKWYIKHN